MAGFTSAGISITPEQRSRIEALAAKRGSSFSETTRSLINMALPFAEQGSGIDFVRLVTILEYCVLATDALLLKLVPEDWDRLLDQAMENAEKYHHYDEAGATQRKAAVPVGQRKG